MSMSGLRALMDGVAEGDESEETTAALVIALSNTTSQLDTKRSDWLWQTALALYPEGRPRGAAVLYAWALRLAASGRLLEAADRLRDALLRDPTLLAARDSLESVCSLVVDRWHFRMLNDRARNEAFNTAIGFAVRAIRGCTVLDIGGGTGLLSMFAVRAGARHVYCCESSSPLCQLAEEIISTNGMSDRITVLHAHSSELTIDRMGGRVDVIVSELLDSGLLGEHIVSVLADARDRLLKQGGLIIPHSAQLFGCIIESSELASRQWHNDPSLVMCVQVDEVYTCEALQSLSHLALTPILSLGVLDLLTLATQSQRWIVHTTALHSGNAHALAYWFRLHLLPPDMPVVQVDTRPGRPGCGWDQAMLFLGIQGRFESISHGQTITMRIHVTVDGLTASFTSLAVLPSIEPRLLLGEMDIAALNDRPWQDALYAATLQQKSNNIELWRVLELTCQWVPASLRDGGGSGWVFAVSDDQAAFHSQLNDMLGRVDMLTTSVSPIEFFLANPIALSGLSTCTAVVCDLIEGSGLLRQRALREAQMCIALLQNTLYRLFPWSLRVHVVLCEGTEETEPMVSAVNTCGVNVSAINRFASTRLCELRLASMRLLSDEQVGVTFDLANLASLGNTETIAQSRVTLIASTSGRVRLIGYWFDMCSDSNGTCAVSTGPSSSSHWRQAACVLPEVVEVVAGQAVGVLVTATFAYGIDCRVETSTLSYPLT